MGLEVAVAGRPFQEFVAVKNARADAGTIYRGYPVEYKPTANDGISVRQPLLSVDEWLLGIAVEEVEYNDQRNAAVCTAGVVKARVKGASTATVGSYLLPLKGQDYLISVPFTTRFQLLTDLTADTNVYGPDNGSSAPSVLIRPMSFNTKKVMYWPDAAAPDLVKVAADQTTAGAADLTLVTATQNPDYPRILTIESTGNISAVTFTVYGTDIFDNAITDPVTGPNNSTVYTVKAFKTVTRVAVDGAVGTNTSMGWGAKLGLPYKLSGNVRILGVRNGALEGTAPTITASATLLANNIVSFNTALAGNASLLVFEAV